MGDKGKGSKKPATTTSKPAAGKPAPKAGGTGSKGQANLPKR